MNYSKIKTFSRHKPKPPSHTRRNVAAVLVVLLCTFGIAQVSAMSNHSARTEPVKPVAVVQQTVAHKQAVKSAEKASEVITPKSVELKPTPAPVRQDPGTPPATPRQESGSTPATEVVAPTPEPAPVVRDPNGCEAKGMYFRADNNECIPKAETVVVTAPVASAPAPVATAGSGDCASEIGKYDWNQNTAYAIMMAESTNDPGVVNDNPATGDYSVGCFQINLYGANAASRPSEEWLKVAANNVEYAYGIYSRNGNSFLGQWGACSKVGCY